MTVESKSNPAPAVENQEPSAADLMQVGAAAVDRPVPAASVSGADASQSLDLDQPRIETPLLWSLFQRGLGLLGIVCLSPMFLVVFILVKATSRGPFLFQQVRRGHGGEKFTILKVRTMRTGSEAKTRLGVSIKSSQITGVGRVLRKLKIDELTQLWNIVRGDMEIVGPRPIPIALEDKLREEIPRFRERNRVKPGLTSFSQVVVVDNGVGDRLIDDWSERFQAELHYIRRKSVGYDIIVIAMSGLYVLRMLASVVGLRRGQRGTVQKLQSGPAETTEVIGVRIANADYDQVLRRIAGWVENRGSHYIPICPVHSVMESVLHESHRESLANASLNTADGMPVVWAQKLLGYRPASRVYGPTLMLKTLARAERQGWRVALYGGHPERLQILIDRLMLQFPKLEIVNSISPPFRALTTEEDQAIVDEINEARPDVIFVGLGCPKQERWMFEHSPRIPGVMLGVGAAFDFHAKCLPVAPPFMQKIGMEWFFRLCCEPRRLFKRYATTNPLYLMMLFGQVFKRFVLRRNYQVAGIRSGDAGREASERSDAIANPK